MPTSRVAANTYAVRQIHRGEAGSMTTGGAVNSAGTSYSIELQRIVQKDLYPTRRPSRQAIIGVQFFDPAMMLAAMDRPRPDVVFYPARIVASGMTPADSTT